MDDDNTITVDIGPDGRVHAVWDRRIKAFLESPGLRTARASHIVPINPILRILFVAMRRCLGDTGPMAAWTRVWPCRWMADMSPSNGPLMMGDDGLGFRDRGEAIAAERKWLLNNNNNNNSKAHP